MNRLAGETSPYLAMHAEDPVEWFPWGNEAFQTAAAESRPIFLSIGYSSCHWCHVMQRESFKDDETARMLNDHFLPVKVDREQRPDVDALYMDYVIATTGHGGWPMSVFCTPQKLPVVGGTYFPPRANGQLPGLDDVMAEVIGAFRRAPDQTDDTAARSLRFLQEHNGPPLSRPITWKVVEDAAEVILRGVDREHGGFGYAPKFPQATVLAFLAAFHRRSGDPEVAYQLRRALEAMLRGGIYDQAGGGLFRYSTDESWLVPHFEKMLYDQALLLSNLAAAIRIEPSEEFEHAIRQTVTFLDREMTAPGGGYRSSLSAETDGVEGATYVWTYEELASLLSAEEMSLAERALGVQEPGNWEGKSILARRDGRAEEADAIDELLSRILAERGHRPQPAPDTKVLTSWNALAARGLLEAGDVLGDSAMVNRGAELASLLLDGAAAGDGVVHVLGDPAVAEVRLAEDHALLAAACLTAHEVTGDAGMLEEAERLHAHVLERFSEGGVTYMTPDGTDLPVRPLERSDNPTPSGRATTVENAVRLLRLTGREEYREYAEDAFPHFWSVADNAPSFAGTALVAASEYLGAT